MLDTLIGSCDLALRMDGPHTCWQGLCDAIDRDSQHFLRGGEGSLEAEHIHTLRLALTTLKASERLFKMYQELVESAFENGASPPRWHAP